METLNKNKAGMVKKAEAGIFPGCDTLGYRNVRQTLDEAWIESDPETLIIEAFRLAAADKLSG